MYRDEYKRHRRHPVVLSTTIADSGAIFSPMVPWNVHGAFVAGALGMGVLTFAPLAYLCWLSPIVTVVLGFIYFNKQTLPAGADAEAVYGAEPTSLPEQQLTA